MQLHQVSWAVRHDVPPSRGQRHRHWRRVRVHEGDDKETTPVAKNDILERLAKAKAYKAQKEKREEDVVLPASPSAFDDELERPEDSDRRLSESAFRAKFNRGRTETEGPGFRGAVEVDRPIEETTYFRGSADRAASFLSNENIDMIKPEERPENSMMAEGRRTRHRGAEVISVDKSYRPKVSTWGMYPRPANISETYGGGRKIDPSEPLESEEDEKRREAEIASALLDYKKKKGLYIDPDDEVVYSALYNDGEAFMKRGNLAMASLKFSEASKVVDFKTRYGGDALFKHAICLDSMGDNKPAKAIYEQLSNHPQSDVRTQARRMLFGFKAMEHLKVAKMKRVSLSKEYEPYFNKLPQEWNSSYLSKDDVDVNVEVFDENMKLAVWMSSLMILMPLALILTLALS